MSRQHYIDKLVDHYESPRHRGALPEADIVVHGINSGCGDTITIYLNVGEGDIAVTVQFEGEGCTISQGAASILMDKVQQKPLAEIQAMDYNDLVEELGKEIVSTRIRCAILGLQTLKDAIKQHYTRRLQVSS
jgi:nitrogen fixation NifU-like protein